MWYWYFYSSIWVLLPPLQTHHETHTSSVCFSSQMCFCFFKIIFPCFPKPWSRVLYSCVGLKMNHYRLSIMPRLTLHLQVQNPQPFLLATLFHVPHRPLRHTLKVCGCGCVRVCVAYNALLTLWSAIMDDKIICSDSQDGFVECNHCQTCSQSQEILYVY